MEMWGGKGISLLKGKGIEGGNVVEAPTALTAGQWAFNLLFGRAHSFRQHSVEPGCYEEIRQSTSVSAAAYADSGAKIAWGRTMMNWAPDELSGPAARRPPWCSTIRCAMESPS